MDMYALFPEFSNVSQAAVFYNVLQQTQNSPPLIQHYLCPGSFPKETKDSARPGRLFILGEFGR